MSWMAAPLGERPRRLIIVGLVVLQILVLTSLLAMRGAHIADGTTVRLEVAPVDPLDIARGAYTTLDYRFVDELQVPEDAVGGEELYIQLEERPTGMWQAVRAYTDRDELSPGATWITLLVSDGQIDTEPISTYYSDAAEARRLEKELSQRGAAAVIVLDSEGNPMLEEVEPLPAGAGGG